MQEPMRNRHQKSTENIKTKVSVPRHSFHLFRLLSILVVLCSSLTMTACRFVEQVQEEVRVTQEEAKQKEIDAIVASLQNQLEDKFYYQSLQTTEDKELYALILHNAQAKVAGEEPVFIAEEEYYMNYVVLNDFPEYFWLYADAAEARDDTDQQLQTYHELQRIGQEIISQIPAGASDYEKVKYIYESVIHRTDYNQAALTNDRLSTQNQTITSVLIDQLSVCGGYSRTIQFLCQLAGINAIYVTGMIPSTEGASEIYHAWNLVEIDGQWYGVDATWGDPTYHEETSPEFQTGIDYGWLCVPDVILNRTHQADLKLFPEWSEIFSTTYLNYPSFTDNSLNYFAQKGAYFESYQEDILVSYLTNQLAIGQTSIDLQFANKSDFDAFLATLEAQNNIFAETIYYQVGRDSYSWVWSEELYSVTLVM